MSLHLTTGNLKFLHVDLAAGAKRSLGVRSMAHFAAENAAIFVARNNQSTAIITEGCLDIRPWVSRVVPLGKNQYDARLVSKRLTSPSRNKRDPGVFAITFERAGHTQLG